MSPRNPAMSPGNAPATVPTVTLENYTRDLLRCVKIDARSLTQTIQRLGGGDQGLQVLLSHIKLWAKERMSANSIAERLESLSGTLNASSSVEHALPSFSDNLNANPEDELIPYAITAQTTNQAVYIRALRKARLARQRRHNNPPRPRLEDYSPSSTPWQRRTTGGEGAGIGGKWQGYDPGSADDRHDCAFLFHKELRASDVNNLGRIVLPKKDAERHLPSLTNSVGIPLLLEDYQTSRCWAVRYRFWSNNKSRMYLLENIGKFVDYHKLKEGDLFVCYRKFGGTYVIRGLKKTMCSEVQVPIKEPSFVVHNSIIQTREEPKDFLGRHDTLHMDQEEKKRTAIKAQVPQDKSITVDMQFLPADLVNASHFVVERDIGDVTEDHICKEHPGSESDFIISVNLKERFVDASEIRLFNRDDYLVE